ncbi:GNAT superfamily N-acetyltransferase [Psychromicrobium silvestre]|uniref:GNAT superfamily N-acetyltransferase n=1 Tax=Psychromicrobium silvestre TaxID=1645614 RepID=A0A7Y9LRK8_9MICC|nr:GNAT family N-acetyltransferase [Psychromicrobium silvestre]NYE94299.1 GNAT superfamily N-acetyltransferase [Psychromicrobium silvestre]
MLALFPESLEPVGLRPALAEAVRLGAATAGIWSNAAVRATEALKLGFDVGWQPWWMAAPLSGFPAAETSDGFSTEQAAGLPEGCWQAEATQNGQWLGRGRVFLPAATATATAPLAGIFDLLVLPEYQRQGLGGRLLRSLAQRAGQQGAQQLVLNSTPAGERLYRAHGFELIGRGRTYWLQL